MPRGFSGNVSLGGGDAGAVLELDVAQILQQQQGTSLVGGVVGDGDLQAGSLGLSLCLSGRGLSSGRASGCGGAALGAAAGGQAKYTGGCQQQRNDLFAFS